MRTPHAPEAEPQAALGRRRALPLVAAAAALLGARCAGPAPQEACRFGAPDPIPVTVAGNLPYLPVTVNGAPVTALLDTGAETTMVSDTLLARVSMPVDPLRHSFQAGATGRTAARRQVYLPRLRFGGREILSQIVSVIAPPGMLGPDGEPPQLIIGGDVLTRFSLDLDLPARRMALHAAERCRLDAPPFAGLVYALPMEVERNHIVVAVEANGRPARAVLDTGANLIHLTRARARGLGVTEEALAAAPRREVRGVNNVLQPVALVRLEALRIGPELHRGVPALVSADGPAEFVIGTPWLLNRRLFVSYVNRRIFVGIPIAAAAAAPRVA